MATIFAWPKPHGWGTNCRPPCLPSGGCPNELTQTIPSAAAATTSCPVRTAPPAKTPCATFAGYLTTAISVTRKARSSCHSPSRIPTRSSPTSAETARTANSGLQLDRRGYVQDRPRQAVHFDLDLLHPVRDLLVLSRREDPVMCPQSSNGSQDFFGAGLFH